MKLSELQASFAEVPLVDQGADPEAPGGDDSLLAGIEETLRKIGVQSARSARELGAQIATLAEEPQKLRQAAEREVARAQTAERQATSLANALVDLLALIERMNASITDATPISEVSEQLGLSSRYALRAATTCGLVEAAQIGESFDVERHDLADELASSLRGELRIEEVVRQGYVFNGHVLRRARVRVASREASGHGTDRRS